MSDVVGARDMLSYVICRGCWGTLRPSGDDLIHRDQATALNCSKCGSFLTEREPETGSELCRRARASCGMTQAEFAALIGIGITTLEDWERGRYPPKGAARSLLRVTAERSTEVVEILRGDG